MKITNQKGFSLLEVALVLGIGTAMAFIKFQDMKSDQEKVMANTVGSQMKQMGEAVNRYISIRYDKLSTLSSSSSQASDPGPRTCSASGCEITYQTLINEGLLPVSYTGINAQKSSYTILLKRSGIAPNYVINGLVTTTQPWSEGNKIRYDLLGRAMQAAGIDSGMTQSATVASGTAGQWTENQNNYSGINAAGLLAYRVGYDSSMYSVYLRRDGTLPMTGDLNMGGKNINNANMVYAQKVSSTDLYVKNSAVFDGVINSLNVINSNTIRSKEFIANTNNTRMTIGGGSSSTDANALSVRLEGGNADGYMLLMDVNPFINDSVKLDVVGSQKIRGDLKITTSGNGKASGGISASGNINSSGIVSGQYLQPTSTVIAGEMCFQNGLIGKDASGGILSCQSGAWKASVTDIKCVHMDNRTLTVKSAWFHVFGDNVVYGGGANTRMDDLHVWCDENGNVSSLVGYPMSN
ncbi:MULTISPECIES: shufflon system plasmid conjugative transfer pilus tip adhesin PilV [Pectobacterium]|uniref:Shufflon system plasmid conjugative transfer pilus tip adhesin PilV n=1 Tax=Pectobacterium polonicum TaxID=2485124 RepID=A0ABV1P9L5_9GAMM|nr:shufflon system plasmid conjugative transfer pilus tip adhesin PilV [Pectobacterium parmentieri]MCL6381501.1 shufflon system plasmid conjugative transfer pilus tip adhesin PilV [Pectobacterium parmentieri]